MAFPAAVGQKYQVIVKSTMDTQQIRTSLWYQLSTLTVGPSTDDICISMNVLLQAAGGVIPKYVAAVPQNCQVDSISIQCVQPTRIRPVEFLVGAGGGHGPCDAPGTSMAVLRVGDAAGRSHQGVLHLPCSTDPGDINQGFLTVGQAADTQAFALQSIGQLTGIAPTYTAVSILSNGPGVANVTLLTRAAFQSTVRTMRRRVVGRGI